MVLIYLILIIFLFYFFNILLNKKIFEHYENIDLLESYELLKVLKNDNDSYYKKFYNIDLKMRNIRNINEYIINIEKSVDNFTNDEKNKIKTCINNAELRLLKIKLNWFDGEKASKIKWIIGCIKGKLYENGLPHTRGNVIILNKENINKYNIKRLTDLLIHEKIHIYQKYYYNDVLKYLKNNNFTKFKERNENDNIRANPDLDNWIYQDKNNNIYKAVYKNNAKTIEDITYTPINNQSYEHPYEKMAIYIENYNS
jgi:hypothetical protein